MVTKRTACAIFFTWFCILTLRSANSEEIRIDREGGVYKVKVEVNSILTWAFVIDSGASEVQVPAEVVLQLIRAGTIGPDDFLPGKTYTMADGSTVKSDRLLLRSLRVGNTTVSNVKASIGSPGATALLGQSFLEKIGQWSLDTDRERLVLGGSERDIASRRNIATANFSLTLPPGFDVPEPFTRAPRMFVGASSVTVWEVRHAQDACAVSEILYSEEFFSGDYGWPLLTRLRDREVQFDNLVLLEESSFYRHDGYPAMSYRSRKNNVYHRVEHIVVKPRVYRIAYWSTCESDTRKPEVETFLTSLKVNK